MGRDYTTLGLIESIKRRGCLPADQDTFSEARMLQFADDEMQIRVVPAVMSLRADHFVTYTDYTTTTETRYDIPKTALNRNLKRVAFLQSDGSEPSLTRIDLDTETEAYWRARVFETGAYYVEGDKIVLYPSSTAGKTLRLRYHRLPNQLVETSAAALVLSVDYDLNVVTCSSVPAAWATGDSLCCVSGDPGFTLRFEAAEALDVSSPTIEFADASEIVAGDWIALEGDSPIPQLPVEAHPILAQCAAVKVLESLGDAKLDSSRKDLAEIMAAYVGVAAPRVEDAPKRVVSHSKMSNYIR